MKMNSDLCNFTKSLHQTKSWARAKFLQLLKKSNLLFKIVYLYIYLVKLLHYELGYNSDVCDLFYCPYAYLCYLKT